VNPSYPADIAARAANLAERAAIVSALGPAPSSAPPTPFESWQEDRLVTRLAARFGQEAARCQGAPRHTSPSLREILSHYRGHEQDIARPGSRLGPALAGLHKDWLPSYQAALDGFDPTASEGAGWREPDVYYGRLATACEPFLLELGRRIARAASRGAVPVDPRVVEDFQDHLLDRFELALAWAVETEAKAYCAVRGIDAARAGQPEYLKYLDETFADATSYHRFYLAFPVLGRWLAHVTSTLAEHASELILRLGADAEAVGALFFGETVTAIRSARLGRSDAHAGARSVAIVEVELAGGAVAPVVYKPRCVGAEAGLQGLLTRLRADGAGDFAERGVLPRAGYGYEALIRPARNRVESAEQAGRVYAELGGYLAIFYVLGGGDLHLENVLVADGHAFICDCETVLGALTDGEARSAGTLMDSVFQTGLIEWPSPATGATMKISGYSGGGAYEVPTAVARVEDRLSFQASVTQRHGTRVDPGAANRVFIGDQLTQPEDFADAISAGFDRVYRWFQQDPRRAAECVRDRFTGTSVRFINWSTQVYAQLLQAARHPTCLMEPLQVDLLFSAVRTFPRNWDDGGVLPDWELASMWRLDIPLFTAEATGDRLVHDHVGDVPARLASAPLDFAAERIARLSPGNRAQQHQYIAAALSGGDVTSPEFASTCLEQASRIGRRLCAMLRDPGAPAPWTSYMIGADGRVEADIEADLYTGSAGIALFLAYLGDLDPRPEFGRAARRALDHALATWNRRRIGAFTGLGGMVYLLTHLHHLWGERGLLDRAVTLAGDLSARIRDDRQLDIFHGAAGLIPVMLGLAGQAGGLGLEQAHECAAHLLRHAQADGQALSWPGEGSGPATPNLTGFTHGAGGIGWSLIALGAASGDAGYITAGRRAFAYEASHFDSGMRDWYDLRVVPGGWAAGGRHYANAWCNGAAGIGLSRIDAWARLGKDDDDILDDAYLALSATVRNFPRLGNDSLCHGRSGNAELFLRFAALMDQPAFRLEANVQARSLWCDLDEAGLGEQVAVFPGLMLGMAGFGMHLLRLARPDRVPSVLLLDPPPAARHSAEGQRDVG
jgi:type 2 lantibiotic biosynthesis protein LanM